MYCLREEIGNIIGLGPFLVKKPILFEQLVVHRDIWMVKRWREVLFSSLNIQLDEISMLSKESRGVGERGDGIEICLGVNDGYTARP